MHENFVKDWIEEFQKVTINDVASYGDREKNNQEIVSAIFTIFKTSSHSQLTGAICNQLFEYYQTGNVHLQNFTLQLLPLFVVTYLETVVDKQSNQFLETLLISLFNLEMLDQPSGRPKIISYRIPSIAQPSIYHEPINISSSFLTERSLRHWEECNTKLVCWGPNNQIEAFNSQNRLKIITALMFIYNLNLKQFNRTLLDHVCKLYSRLVTRGFSSRSSTEDRRRIPISSALLLEMLQTVYCALDDSTIDEKRSTKLPSASQALEDITFRAKYESYSMVVLKSNAIRNQFGTSVQHIRNIPSVSKKSLITNASFRVKKLPDDIPILENDQQTPDDSNLDAINEENEDQQIPTTSGSANTEGKKILRNGSIKNLSTMKNLPKNISSAITKKSREVRAVLKNTPILHSSSKQPSPDTSVELSSNVDKKNVPTTIQTNQMTIIDDVEGDDKKIEVEKSNGKVHFSMSTNNTSLGPTDMQVTSL